MSAINVQAPGWERLYPDRCQFEEKTTTRNARNTPVDDWAPVPGLESVPCAVKFLAGDEGQTSGVQSASATHTIKLQGNFPVKRQYRAKVTHQNGEQTTYSIQAVAPTSGGSRTKVFATEAP